VRVFAVSLLFADLATNIGQIIVNFLAIVGGFLIGNVLALIVIRLFVRKFAKGKKIPRMVEQLIRTIAGLIVAFLVAIMVFGNNGWGFGGTGGGQFGGEGGGEAQQQATQQITESPTPPDTKVEPLPEQKKDDNYQERVRVVVLGGDAKEDRFYLFEEDKEAISLTDLKRKIDTQNAQKPIRRLTVYVYKNSAALDSAVVGDLKELARKQGLSIDFPPVQKELRPLR
jgi:hypothetical protein